MSGRLQRALLATERAEAATFDSVDDPPAKVLTLSQARTASGDAARYVFHRDGHRISDFRGA